MKTVAVLLDDAPHARQVLGQALEHGAGTRWILVAAAPARPRHLGCWMSASARRHAIERWSQALFTDLEPWLALHPGHGFERVTMRRSWTELEAQLISQHPGLQVLDARRRPRGDHRVRGARPHPASHLESHPEPHPEPHPRSFKAGGVGAWLSAIGLGTWLVVAD